MPCDTRLKPRQTLAQRKEEVRKDAQNIDKLVATKKVGVKVGPQGAVAFTGLSEEVRDGLTDACIYRMLSLTGSPQTKMELARVAPLVSRSALAQGIHSHDGGQTWHPRG